MLFLNFYVFPYLYFLFYFIYFSLLLIFPIFSPVFFSSCFLNVRTDILSFDVTTAVLLLSIGPVIGSIVNGQNYHRGRRISVRVGAALVSLLYKKSLSVDLNESGQGVGVVNNLISVDMKEIQELACFSQYLWCTVFEAIICLGLLFLILGYAALGGILVMLIAIPIGAYGTNLLDLYQSKLLKDKDERISVVQEAIQGIRIVKWFAWENQFMDKISEARKQEISSLRSYLIVDALLKINWGLVPTLVGLASFLIHTSILKKELSASVGFTSILLFNLLRWPLTIFPDMVNSFVRARVSVRRIEEYLRATDVIGLNLNFEKSGENSYEGQGQGQGEKYDFDYSNNSSSLMNDTANVKSSTNIDKIDKFHESGKFNGIDGMTASTSSTTSISTSSSTSTSTASVTLKNVSFGWAIHTIQEEDSAKKDSAKNILLKNKIYSRLDKFRFRFSSTNANISVAGDSDKEDLG